MEDRFGMSRREILVRLGELGLIAVASPLLPAYAWSSHRTRSPAETAQAAPIELVISRTPFRVGGCLGNAFTINGTVPGPLIRMKEGQEAVIRVINGLAETTSIHWHGLLVPPEMDGVPGVSFAGIPSGKSFEYRFTVRQNGTYWYHSHSGGQEQKGVYGPIVIEPKVPAPFFYDRDYVVLLSDWTFEEPMDVVTKLKKSASYYNYQRRTVQELFQDISHLGLGATLSNRLEWDKMRMDPTDFSDVTASTYTYLMNGLSPSANWRGTFRKGERIRLRFIGGAAMTIFDVRIPGLKLNVVQADGQNVQPVLVDEFRIAPGETYDVIVEPPDERPYALFAESIDRSGFAMGTLSPGSEGRAQTPERRKRAIRGMADMGMSMDGMKMGSEEKNIAGAGAMPGMAASGMSTMAQDRDTSPIPGSTPVKHGPDHHGAGNSVVPMEIKSRLHEPGTGLENTGTRVLVYTDLKSLTQGKDRREPAREIELHLTGNMERYMWSIDGKKYSDSPTPIPFRLGERLRLTLVNDTMMEHPMHLHGMWMYLENGHGASLPRKHTILVKPAERLSVAITADAVGKWTFHCHLLLHMELGMFRVVQVLDDPSGRTS